jgi:putative spermidine/putrescine transport system permease protein
MTYRPASGGRSVAVPNRLKLFVFALPALALVLVAFVWPISLALMKSAENSELRQALPHVAAQLRAWDGSGLPPESSQGALANDLVLAAAGRRLGLASRRLNMEIPGFSALLQKTARDLQQPTSTSHIDDRLRQIDARWGEPRYWLGLQRASWFVTDLYFLTAIDLRRDDTGAVVPAPEDRRLYVEVILRSLSVALTVTIAALILAYPMSYLFASLRPMLAAALLLLVLLPFWTSTLVRTAAWLVLLQREGLVNSTLLGVGLIGAPLPLIFNRFGVVIALTQVLLPYMVLTLYSVMRGIDGRYVRAAHSLGASPWQAFTRIYLPLTVSGVGAGCLLVFILAIGSYVTPALIGGRHDQMLSYYIAFNINQTVNWGLSAALSVMLVAVVFALYVMYGRIAGLGRVRAG